MTAWRYAVSASLRDALKLLIAATQSAARVAAKDAGALLVSKQFGSRGSGVGSDIRTLKDTAGLQIFVITELLVFDAQDIDNSTKQCFRYFGIAKDINE